MTELLKIDYERAKKFAELGALICKADAARSIEERTSDGACCVYFVRESGMGAIKIGTTGDFKSRLSMLRSHTPHEVTVLALVPGDERLEKYAHNRLYDFRIRGEWFRCAPELIAFVEALKAGEPVLSEEERAAVAVAAATCAEPFAPSPKRKKRRRAKDSERRTGFQDAAAPGMIGEALDRRKAAEEKP